MRQFTILLALLLACTAGTVRADEPVRVACVGNSITQGVGTRNQYQNSYPGVLRQLLGQGYDVRNFGYSGRTALRRGDYPYLRERMLVDAVNYRPDILIVKLGTNDSKPWNWKFHADFERDLTEIVESFRRPEGLPRVYLCLPVPSFLAPGSIDSAVIAHEVVPAVRRVARRLGAHVIDLHTPMKAYARCFPDGIHPNEEGAARMAALVYEALTGREAPDYTPGQPFPGRRSEWEGYARYDFIHAGREATVVAPRKAAPGRPWIWRPAFFGAFPSVDKALLERGFHVAYYDLTHLYGSPRAVRLADDFYGTMRRYYGLSPHVTLEGFSRGALLVWNWAARNPDKVACIYVDAPVCDVLSWPGRRQKDLWADLLAEWGIEDSKADTQFARMALKALPRLAKAGIPIIAVCGDADRTVPFAANMQPVADAYAKLGGVAELIVKPGCDHHPHSLDDPAPVVDFILRYQDGYTARQHLTRRAGTARAFRRFRETGKGCVAFFGGSITAMRGWKEELAALSAGVPEEEKPTVYAGAVNWSGSHGIEGSYGQYPPFVAAGANNVVDSTGADAFVEIDREQITAWDPDYIFLTVDNMGIVNEDYAQNPNYYDTLSAVQEGHVYSQVGFNYYWTNQELAVVNSYYVASVLYPEAFESVDFEARAEEIFNTMLGSDFLDVLEENGMYFGPVTIGG